MFEVLWSLLPSGVVADAPLEKHSSMTKLSTSVCAQGRTLGCKCPDALCPQFRMLNQVVASGLLADARACSAGFFEVKKISPPAESLGIHELPHNTHNGDMISVHGEVRPPLAGP